MKHHSFQTSIEGEGRTQGTRGEKKPGNIIHLIEVGKKQGPKQLPKQ